MKSEISPPFSCNVFMEKRVGFGGEAGMFFCGAIVGRLLDVARHACGRLPATSLSSFKVVFIFQTQI
ncbi:hypothetical protein [Bacteroides sp.]|uniref:hypothetical protein n=1 Tax=Bacteroides sp. TaxID=29523 RepID=UPI0023CB375B|nr:hypothetical protein [Bacteroides sp.]MDE6215823.1 hypothetical protein [Bacteroides sp.]